MKSLRAEHEDLEAAAAKADTVVQKLRSEADVHQHLVMILESSAPEEAAQAARAAERRDAAVMAESSMAVQLRSLCASVEEEGNRTLQEAGRVVRGLTDAWDQVKTSKQSFTAATDKLTQEAEALQEEASA